MTTPVLSPDLSPAGVMLVVAAALVGPEVAPYVSAYSLILIGWCAGLLVGVYRRPPDGRRMPILAFAFVSLIAVFGTGVIASQWLAPRVATILGVPSVEPTGLLLPFAAAVPAIGHNWIDLIGEAARRARIALSWGKSR